MVKRLFFVERLAGRRAVLIEQNANATDHTIPRHLLPSGTKAGDWVSIEVPSEESALSLRTLLKDKTIVFVPEEEEREVAKNRIRALREELSN